MSASELTLEAFFLLGLGALIAAQILRSFRYWLILAEPTTSYRFILGIFLLTSALAFRIPLIFTEPLRILALCFGTKSRTNCLSSYLFHRLLDILAVVIVAIAFILIGRIEVSSSTGEHLFLLSTFGVTFLIFFLSAPRFLVPLQVALLRRPNVAFGKEISMTLGRLSRDLHRISNEGYHSLGLLSTLTILPWLLDGVGIFLIGSKLDLLNTFALWVVGGTLSVFLETYGRFPHGARILDNSALSWIIAIHIAFSALLFLRMAIQSRRLHFGQKS